jgi:hypothetical protein
MSVKVSTCWECGQIIQFTKNDESHCPICNKVNKVFTFNMDVPIKERDIVTNNVKDELNICIECGSFSITEKKCECCNKPTRKCILSPVIHVDEVRTLYLQPEDKKSNQPTIHKN